MSPDPLFLGRLDSRILGIFASRRLYYGKFDCLWLQMKEKNKFDHQICWKSRT